ncbi:signal peptide protein [Angomonas deanei]|nr:signal peptide protein [Angomonas deanei]|eukprot:EPY18277.1 signal peptide protein [Angomonas deanei]
MPTQPGYWMAGGYPPQYGFQPGPFVMTSFTPTANMGAMDPNYYANNYSDSSPVRRNPGMMQPSSASNSLIGDAHLYGFNSTSNISDGTSISKCHLSRKDDHMNWSPTAQTYGSSPHSFAFGNSSSNLERARSQYNYSLYGDGGNKDSPNECNTSSGRSRSVSLFSNLEESNESYPAASEGIPFNETKGLSGFAAPDSVGGNTSSSAVQGAVGDEMEQDRPSAHMNGRNSESLQSDSAAYSYGSVAEALNVSPLSVDSRKERQTTGTSSVGASQDKGSLRFVVSPPPMTMKRQFSFTRRQYMAKSAEQYGRTISAAPQDPVGSRLLVDSRKTQSCPSSPLSSSMKKNHNNNYFGSKKEEPATAGYTRVNRYASF